MNPEIKRQTELYIIGKLQGVINDHTFYPYTGGSQSMGAQDVEPPFTVISITSAEKVMATESTWLCRGTAQVITHHSESTSEEQSELARRVYAALTGIPNQADAIFSFHGIDITETTYANDDERAFHADIFNFTAGVGG